MQASKRHHPSSYSGRTGHLEHARGVEHISLPTGTQRCNHHRRRLAQTGGIVAPKEQLGEERKLVIEALAVLASHAAKPEPQRKPSLMKLNWDAVAKILSASPELEHTVGSLTAQLRQRFKW